MPRRACGRLREQDVTGDGGWYRGHVFPGLAVADRLKAQGWTIHWLGTADRMEAELVPAHGYPISFIDIQGCVATASSVCSRRPTVSSNPCCRPARCSRPSSPMWCWAWGLRLRPGWRGRLAVRHSAAAARAECRRRPDQQAAGPYRQAGADGLPRCLRPQCPHRRGGQPGAPEVVALPDPQLRSSSDPLRLLVVGGSLGPGSSTSRCLLRLQLPVCPSRCVTSAARAMGRPWLPPMPGWGRGRGE